MDDLNLEEIAEGDAHATWTVTEHSKSVRDGRRPRCTICEEWWPCDRAGLAARAVLHAEEVRRLREQVRIAQGALGQIVHDYDGCEVATCKIVPGIVADDALTRMDAVE